MRPIAAVLPLALLAAACDRGGPAREGNGPMLSPEQAAGGRPASDDDDEERPDPGRQEVAKLNGYVKGYNTLISTFGLRAQEAQYRGQQIERKGVNDGVFVLPGWLDNGLGEIRAARALPGGTPELDRAADGLLPVLTRLVGELKGLQSYYQSRGQLADGFARGRREHPQVLADFAAAGAANDRLSAAIDVAQDRRDAAELASLKASGDAVGYQGALALGRAKLLLRLTDSPAALADPARAGAADRAAGELVAALAALRTGLAGSDGNRDPDHGLRNSMYDTVADRLDGMVGAYRDLKRTGQGAFREGMVTAFNDAVEHANLS